jgi:AcrR family transcriptional regulator
VTGRRPYRLGKRQAAVQETRRRIIDAAITEYADHGIEGTSMLAVARRADVAPGTVLYQFQDADSLADVVVDSLYERYAAPSVESIPVDQPLSVRIATLVGELYGVYERTSLAYRIYQRSADHPAMQRANAEWERIVGEMLVRALGDRAADREALQLVSVMINPGFRGTLIMSGFDSDRAAEVATELALKWLE